MDEIVKDDNDYDFGIIEHGWRLRVEKTVLFKKGEITIPQLRKKVPLEGKNHNVEQHEQNEKGLDRRNGTEINALSRYVITTGQGFSHN